MFNIYITSSLFCLFLSVLTWSLILIVATKRGERLFQIIPLRSVAWFLSLLFCFPIVAIMISVYIKPLPGFRAPQTDEILALFIVYPIFFGIIGSLIFYFLIRSKNVSLIETSGLRYWGKYFCPVFLSLFVGYFGYYYSIHADIVDGINYYFLYILILFFFAIHQMKTKNEIAWLNVIILLLVVTSVYVTSANRVLGYPDDIDDTGWSILIFCFSCFAILFMWSRQKHRFAILCTALLLLPIVEIEKDALRQVVGYELIDSADNNERPANFFISKITADKIYAIAGDNSYYDRVLVYVRAQGSIKFVFNNNDNLTQNVFYFGGGGGSMEAQIPNFSLFSKRILPKIISLFLEVK